jgi:regulator of sirC expression with transglutaminase-like and TPR domain
VYVQAQDPVRAIRVLDQILVLTPESAVDRRDRGLLLFQEEQFGRALEDLEDYARSSPGAEDAGRIRDQIGLTRKLLARMN